MQYQHEIHKQILSPITKKYVYSTSKKEKKIQITCVIVSYNPLIKWHYDALNIYISFLLLFFPFLWVAHVGFKRS